MEEPVLLLLSISVLFFVLLFVKQALPHRLKDKLCVLCAAVSLTWLGFLILYWAGMFSSGISIAILMGSTALGIFYITEKKLDDKWHVFRLPFYATLFLAALVLVTQEAHLSAWLFAGLLWMLFLLLFVYRNNTRIKNFIQKITACCRNW